MLHSHSLSKRYPHRSTTYKRNSNKSELEEELCDFIELFGDDCVSKGRSHNEIGYCDFSATSQDKDSDSNNDFENQQLDDLTMDYGRRKKNILGRCQYIQKRECEFDDVWIPSQKWENDALEYEMVSDPLDGLQSDLIDGLQSDGQQSKLMDGEQRELIEGQQTKLIDGDQNSPYSECHDDYYSGIHFEEENNEVNACDNQISFDALNLMKETDLSDCLNYERVNVKCKQENDGWVGDKQCIQIKNEMADFKCKNEELVEPICEDWSSRNNIEDDSHSIGFNYYQYYLSSQQQLGGKSDKSKSKEENKRQSKYYMLNDQKEDSDIDSSSRSTLFMQDDWMRKYNPITPLPTKDTDETLTLQHHVSDAERDVSTDTKKNNSDDDVFMQPDQNEHPETSPVEKDSEEILIKIQEMKLSNKKNVVKNIMNAFKNFVLDAELKNTPKMNKNIVSLYNSAKDDNADTHDEIVKKFKRYINAKNFNHYSMRLLILHPNYGPLLHYFLQEPIIEWAKNCKATDLPSHFVMVDFLLLGFKDIKYIDQLKRHEKKKAHFQ